MVKQRLVGAAVLALLAAIVLPFLFGNPKDPRQGIQASFAGPAQRAEPPPATPRPRQPSSTPRPQLAAAAPAASPGPTSRPTPATAPATPEPSLGHPQDWVLQLASYTQAEAAESFRERLRKEGHAAYREAVVISGKSYYRVRLKVHGTEAEARQLQRKIEKRHRVQAQLLPAR